MLDLPNAPFALLRREGRDHVELLTGAVETVDRLADIPLTYTGEPGPQALAVVPYRQVRERGFDCVDDGVPLSVLRVASHAEVPLDEAFRALPDRPVAIAGGAFDIPDPAYADAVRAVLRDEIGRGEGSNFVIHRVFEATVDSGPDHSGPDHSGPNHSGQGLSGPLAAALAVFRRLLTSERGAYWTFLVHTGDRTLVGATPERHVSVEDGLVLMNPISGTYRHPAGSAGPDREGLLRFLADRKEVDELAMVLDEELKMMATVADLGGQVIGPYLKQMAHLTHTEYLLAGHGSRDVRDVLRETMFAPTVVGSPIENACRVVARHERRGRGYYGGVLALLGHDGSGRQTLDAPILIRTAEFDQSGRLRVPVGATLVRHSTAAGEVAETHAKAAGVLAALGLRSAQPDPPAPAVGADLANDPEIQTALVRRNATLAPFWLHERDPHSAADPALRGRRVLIVDAEDTFTGMLTHQLRVLGLSVTLRQWADPAPDASTAFDLVVPGPGPGDPRHPGDPKMIRMRSLVDSLLAAGHPTLAICLGHQVLSARLGLSLHRKAAPYQGMQREIDFFGRPARVGFYSTFAARCGADWFESPYGPVRVARDPSTGDVHALRGPTFAGVQFHPESVLSEHGIALVRELVTSLIGAPTRAIR